MRNAAALIVLICCIAAPAAAGSVFMLAVDTLAAVITPVLELVFEGLVEGSAGSQATLPR